MGQAKLIGKFVWPYLRPYWKRAVAGVLLGVFFGLSNAGVLWATKTMLERLMPQPEAAESKKEETSFSPPSALLPGGPDLGGENGSQKASQTGEGETNQLGWIKDSKSSVEQTINRWITPFLPQIGEPVTVTQVVGALFFLPAIIALRGFSSYLSTYCLAWTSERIVNDLRVYLMTNLGRLSLDFFDRSKMGDTITRVNRDTRSLHECLSQGVTQLVKGPATIISVFVGLCLIDWQLTLSTLILLPFCVIPVAILGRKARRASREMVNAHVTQANLMLEMLAGIRIVKAYGLEGKQVERFQQLSRDLVRHTLKTVKAKNLTSPIIEIVSGLGIGALILFVALTERSIPQLVTFFMGLAMFYEPIKKFAKLHVIIERASVGVQRIIHLLNEEPSVKEPASPKALTSFESTLSFEGVSFAYGSEPVLRDIHLEIPKGFKLGVAGESGSGKSTLVNLVFRFYDPVQGSIRIDGKDLRDVRLADLRHLMALVSQEVILFDQSVADNIACGRPEATREEIEEAARAAFAHEFISRLSEGYDTYVGERGVTLSGGQRQRIAIARAFVRNAPILVLDEATAALDSQAESQVQSAIDRLTRNRTVICVAHRLATLQAMDKIIVLSEGEIIDSGSFSELLEHGGSFADMAERQGIRLPQYQ